MLPIKKIKKIPKFILPGRGYGKQAGFRKEQVENREKDVQRYGGMQLTWN